jgi:ABC-type amino acid transport system permease subunit
MTPSGEIDLQANLHFAELGLLPSALQGFANGLNRYQDEIRGFNRHIWTSYIEGQKVIPPLLSGGFIEYKSVISVLFLKVGTIVLNHPT